MFIVNNANWICWVSQVSHPQEAISTDDFFSCWGLVFWFFLVLLFSFRENILLLKDNFENKNHSPIVEVSACTVEPMQKSCLSKISGEGPEFSPMRVVLACGVRNEKCMNSCLLWVLLHMGFSNNCQGDEFRSIWRCQSCLEKHRSRAGALALKLYFIFYKHVC